MKKSKNNGITLVALIVTIIILLILAGVAISALTQTGLFENAKQAKNAMENAQNAENETLIDYENKINTIVTGNREDITIDREEYETLKKNSEYENYENLEEVIELKNNIKILEGEVKRQGKIVNIHLFVQTPQTVQADVWTEIGTLKNDKLIPQIDEWGYLAQGTYGGNFVITKDGIIKFRGQSSNTRYIGNITYFSK
ncbi:MAG: hypothetical protein BHW00_04290 [Clostridium sp. 26_22]|nr:MAG: hypothetical protein BHW00_04290 [Clostridium sp. 26_22]